MRLNPSRQKKILRSKLVSTNLFAQIYEITTCINQLRGIEIFRYCMTFNNGRAILLLSLGKPNCKISS